MKEKIELKLKEIATILVEQDLSNIHQSGLLAGTSGVACFMNEYGQYTKDEFYQNATIDIIERTFDLVLENDPFPTHCSGLAGVALFLSDLENEGIIEDCITKDIDTYLQIAMIQEMQKEHYDFLHGAIGIGNYFVERAEKKKKYQAVVKQTIKYLDRTAEKYTENGIKFSKWKSFDFKTGEKTYNISMSHGISSIIAVLINMYKASYNLNRKKIVELIEGGVNYILAQEIDKNQYGSYFPYLAKESTKEIIKSRLAWCYGDLGIASVIWQAGKVLENETWKNKAIEVMLHASKRREPNETDVVDACLCHGTAGNAMIFKRMYLNTGIEEFKETSDFWIEETLKLATFEDGLAGFKTYHGVETEQWINDIYMLEGISGIGLALLSAISDRDPAWDKYLLLS